MRKLKNIRKELIGIDEQPLGYQIREHLEECLLNVNDKFEHKYNHFLAIVCAHTTKSVQTYGAAFCNFVEPKIRLQLLFTIENIKNGQNQHLIDYCQVKPERMLDGKECPERFVSKPSMEGGQQWLCTIWLVGIKPLVKETMHTKWVLEGAFHWQAEKPLNKFANNLREGFKLPPATTTTATSSADEQLKLNTAVFAHYIHGDALLKWLREEEEKRRSKNGKQIGCNG